VGNTTAATYYDNVRVPRDMLVGELHGGWKLITAQLNHERLGLGAWADKVFAPFRRVLAVGQGGRRIRAGGRSTSPGCAGRWPTATCGSKRSAR
jgi:alkylation response protein AidB-like acyl-CoA dehydrogenase